MNASLHLASFSVRSAARVQTLCTVLHRSAPFCTSVKLVLAAKNDVG
jgi:hypothetical protein